MRLGELTPATSHEVCKPEFFQRHRCGVFRRQAKEQIMSNTQFVESSSSDPVERAIARKVIRVLNDTSLDRQQREALIKKSQRDLISHRKQMQEQSQLRQKLAQTRLPQGYKPQSIQVCEGRVQVGLINRRLGFTWLDAGEAPLGAAANQSVFALSRPKKGAEKRPAKDPIAERRLAMGFKPMTNQAQAKTA
jgi:hypothetical protein